MLGIERRRLALSGKNPGEITEMLQKYIEFYNDYLKYKNTPGQVIQNKPHLKRYLV